MVAGVRMGRRPDITYAASSEFQARYAFRSSPGLAQTSAHALRYRVVIAARRREEGAHAPCKLARNPTVADAFDTAVKRAFLSALRTRSQQSRYWAWSGRGASVIRRPRKAAPSSATYAHSQAPKAEGEASAPISWRRNTRRGGSEARRRGSR